MTSLPKSLVLNSNSNFQMFIAFLYMVAFRGLLQAVQLHDHFYTVYLDCCVIALKHFIMTVFRRQKRVNPSRHRRGGSAYRSVNNMYFYS